MFMGHYWILCLLIENPFSPTAVHFVQESHHLVRLCEQRV